MKNQLQFTESADRKFPFSHIRNVAFLGDHYDFNSVYYAMADYDPAGSGGEESCSMPGNIVNYDYIMPDSIISINPRRKGVDCKLNLFCGHVVPEYMVPNIADGVIHSVRIQADGGLNTLYWHDYLVLKENYNIPSMIVLGRFADECREGFYKTVENIKKQYGINALPFVIPAGESRIVDVLAQKCFKFSENGKMAECAVPEEFAGAANDALSYLISAAAEDDEQIMDDFICNRTLDMGAVKKNLQQKVFAGKIVPVFYCRPFHRRSFSIVYGVELLLDAIIDYLPSPVEGSCGLRAAAEKAGIRYCCDDASFAAVVFYHSSNTVCFRVLSGVLSKGCSVINTRTGEGISMPFSDAVCSGDIGIVTAPGALGFSNDAAQVKSCYLEMPAEDLMKLGIRDVICDKSQPVSFQLPIAFAEPVMAVALPYDNQKEYDAINRNLALAKLEFPSLRVFKNESAGVITAAIDYKHINGLLAFVSSGSAGNVPVEVFYREKLRQETTCECEYTGAGGQADEYAGCVLEVVPMNCSHGITIADCTDKNNAVPQVFIDAVKEGICEAVWAVDVPGHYPLTDFHVNILECSFKPEISTADAFRKAGFAGLKSAAEKVGTSLLEPVAKIKFAVTEDLLAEVLPILTDARGTVTDIISSDSMANIQAEVPYAELQGLSERVRHLQYCSSWIVGTKFNSVPDSVAEKIKKQA